MSAFMVSDLTYDSVALTLGQMATQPAEMYAVLEMFIADDKRNPINVVDAFVNKLKEMNIEALKQRYPDHADMHNTFEPIQPTKGRRLTKVELFKQLTCISYQLSEGDVPLTHVYKQLDKLSELLAYHIVCSSDEYDRADWGL
jgi:hypothetical protein